MSCKTTNAYLVIFRELRDNVLINPNEIRLIISDYELALRNAASRVFVGAHIGKSTELLTFDFQFFCFKKLS